MASALALGRPRPPARPFLGLWGSPLLHEVLKLCPQPLPCLFLLCLLLREFLFLLLEKLVCGLFLLLEKLFCGFALLLDKLSALLLMLLR